MTISLSPTPKLPSCLSSERLPYDVISGVIAGLQKVYPHFSAMPDGLVHESEEKLRAHFLHTGTPSATGLRCTAGMLRPRGPHGQIIRHGHSLGLTLSGLGLDLGLMASGLGLIEIGLVASNIYSAHDIN